MSAPDSKADGPWSKETKKQFIEYELHPSRTPPPDKKPALTHSRKSKSKWLDPCAEAAAMSIKCLNRNGGDRAMCQDYFS